MASVTIMVRNEPTTAPQMPASSGSRLAPVKKKIVLNLLWTRFCAFNSSSQTISLSEIFRELSGVSMTRSLAASFAAGGVAFEGFENSAFGDCRAGASRNLRKLDHAAVERHEQ